ncbi:MAG: hypothetical protein E4H33_04880, partial [Anaerolineales bacterium]
MLFNYLVKVARRKRVTIKAWQFNRIYCEPAQWRKGKMKRTLWISVGLLVVGVIFAACANNTEPVVKTETKEPVNTMATIAALSAQTTIVYPTPVGGVVVEGPDDYVGIVKQAWNIINGEYVRGNFNEVDWPAVYDEYVVLAEDVTSSEELWDLLSALVGELDDNHSRFVPPQNMGAEFGIETSADAAPRPGTGIEIWPGPSREDEYFYVWDVCGLSAAASAGIARGDIITAVDGSPVQKDGEE